MSKTHINREGYFDPQIRAATANAMLSGACDLARDDARFHKIVTLLFAVLRDQNGMVGDRLQPSELMSALLLAWAMTEKERVNEAIRDGGPLKIGN